MKRLYFMRYSWLLYPEKKTSAQHVPNWLYVPFNYSSCLDEITACGHPCQPNQLRLYKVQSWMIDECEATSIRSFNCSNVFICTVLCTNTFSIWVCSWNYLSSIEWGNARRMKWIMQLEFTRACCQVYSGGICPSPQSLLLLLIVYSGMQRIASL
jgi:hypothetical protein